MATTGIINTSNMRIYVQGNVIAHATGGTMSFTRDMRDVSTKDTSAWREILPGLKSATANVSSLYAMDAAYGFTDLWALFDAGTEIQVTFTTNASGDDRYRSANAYISSLELNSEGVEESGSYSATFELGSVTETTLT